MSMTEENDLSGLDFVVDMMKTEPRESLINRLSRKDKLLSDSLLLLDVLVKNSPHCFGIDFQLLNETIISIRREVDGN